MPNRAAMWTDRKNRELLHQILGAGVGLMLEGAPIIALTSGIKTRTGWPFTGHQSPHRKTFQFQGSEILIRPLGVRLFVIDVYPIKSPTSY